MKKEENGRCEGNGGGGGEVRQGGIDLPPLCRGTRQVLSAPPLPSLIYPFAHLKSVFFSLPLLSHFLSCFLSTNPFFLFFVLPILSQLVGASSCHEVRTVRDSATHTIQPASPAMPDERGEGQSRWKLHSFCWEYSSGVALARLALERRARVPQVGTP